MTEITISRLGSIGVNTDMPSHMLPPEIWSGGLNVRFKNGKVTKFKGHTQVFGTPSAAPVFTMLVNAAAQNYWVYFSLTDAYGYDGSHTEITRASGDYTGSNERDWQGTMLGGIPVFNNGTDNPQYWPTLSVGTKLADLTNWPASTTAKIIRGFGRYLVAMHVTESGTAKPHLVMWSHAADPGNLPNSWDHTDATKDAGRFELTDVESGHILDAMMLGDLLIVYKERSAHALRIVGGQEVITPRRLPHQTGLLAARCVTPVRKGTHHFVVTADDIIIHNGASAESVVEGFDRKAIFSDLDSTNYENSFCVTNEPEDEAWFCFPTTGQTRPNMAFVWNYKRNTYTFREFSGMWATIGPVTAPSDDWDSDSDTWDSDSEPWSAETQQVMVVADPANTKFHQVDSGETFYSTDMSAYVERTGLAIAGRARDGSVVVNYSKEKLVTRLWPQLTGMGQVSVRMGVQDTVDGVITWYDTQTFTIGTDEYLDWDVSGKFIALRFESLGSDSWELEGYTIDVNVVGTH